MLSRSTKKRSSQVSPTKTSQLLLQRRVPPAATPLSSRAQAALAAFIVLLVWADSACAAGCVPVPLPSCVGPCPVCVPPSPPAGHLSLVPPLPRVPCPPGDVAPDAPVPTLSPFPVMCVECPITLLTGCPLGSNGCVTTDRALNGTDAVASLPDIQRLLWRWKADALKTSRRQSRLRAATIQRRGYVFVLGTHVVYWLLPRRARDHGKTLRYLQRIAEKSDILCRQETHVQDRTRCQYRRCLGPCHLDEICCFHSWKSECWWLCNLGAF